MKFTLEWLRDHLTFDADAAAVADRLVRLGFEVDSIMDPSAEFAAFRVGKVIECWQHPDADRLRVCMVDQGQDIVQVVCGAPNAKLGMFSVFAPVGSWIPGTDLKLKAGKIRGQESNGMLLSERELGLSDEHDGIIELLDGVMPGMPYAQVVGLDDPVIDIEVTPNRGDMLGVRGIARDLAAAGFGKLCQPKWWEEAKVPKPFGPSPIAWAMEGESACHAVRGRYFRGLNNDASPDWLRRRLTAIGLRPISKLVDVTNYITFDLGRPLHLYDAKRLVGDRLVMRRAKLGESMEALNGKTYEVPNGATVIADRSGVQGVGGIIGGMASGCQTDTTEAFLEVALFDAKEISMTGRALGIETDARYRFERLIDPESADWGHEAATALVLALCGGEVSEVSAVGDLDRPKRSISIAVERFAGLGGLEVTGSTAGSILEKLGCRVQVNSDELIAEPPNYRPDLQYGPCLVEEVLRVQGYDAIPAVSLPASNLPERVVTPDQRRRSLMKRALAMRGFHEAVTWSFMDRALASHFGGGQDDLALLHPIASEWNQMRPSVLPNLLEAAQRNLRSGEDHVRLFEVGGTYHGTQPSDQQECAAGVRIDRIKDRHWSGNQPSPNVFDAKADVLATFGALGLQPDRIEARPEAPSWYHPKCSGVLAQGPNILAHFGELHPGLAASLGFNEPVCLFEILISALPRIKLRPRPTRPALYRAKFQAIWRDFSFVVADSVSADRLIRAARQAGKPYVDRVEIFDRFSGKGISDKSLSLGLSVRLQPSKKTLTEAEIETVAAKIIEAVEKAVGATLRS